MADQRRAPDQRPSPEALLEAARREEGRVGKLKIFVGAAPGVGKTYEMLQQARARKNDGYDIVVGVVETHGRKETEALLQGLEVIPRRRLEYKGQWLEEMDLDAIIARRPQIVLVDELAHTNAPGSRHPKRYLDVEEILNHGIDVYSTVNIQHVESLNDVVAQITHVRVRETVPDAVFNRADAVELVDITPDDLIERLKEGKVYVPTQAERALEHFFSPANLTALRELALRRTADAGRTAHAMQAPAIQGPWAAGERILVCVSEDPRGAGLVRYAKRLSDRLHAPFTALAIETRRSLQFGEEQRDRIADTLRLAQALGGEAVTISRGERSIADDVIGYAQANNVTQIIIGNRPVRAGSKSCTARSFMTSCAAPATSALASLPATRSRESRSRKRRSRPLPSRRSSIRAPISTRSPRLRLARPSVSRFGSGSAAAMSGSSSSRQSSASPRVSVYGRRCLRPRCLPFVIISFSPSPITASPFPIRRSPRHPVFHRRGDGRLQRRGAGAYSGDRRDGARARDRVALYP